MKFLKFFYFLMDEAGEGQGGGGAAPDDKEKNKDSQDKTTIEDLKNLIKNMEQKIIDMSVKSKNEKDDKDEKDPINRVKNKQTKEEREKEERANLENTIKFNVELDTFIEKNKTILPENINEIMQEAKKEKYESAIHNANEFKRILVQSFFYIQENKDLLSDSQKEKLDRYLKYTLEAKHNEADYIYEHLFLTALSSKEKIKKAEEIAKSKANDYYGYREGSSNENNYENKLKELSEKYYLGGNK